MKTTLYERLGGESAVQAAVVRLYEKIMADPVLAPFFDGPDLDAQIKKQVAFLSMAFGGPQRYSGRELREAHARPVSAGLGDRHFDAVAGHLHDTLREIEVEAVLIEEVMNIVAGTRDHVLGR